MKTHRTPDNSSDRPLTRQEKFRRRGLPVILGVGAAALATLLVVQTATNEGVKATNAQEQKDEFKQDEAFEQALKDAAIKVANLEDLANPAVIIIPNNDIALYDEAPRVAAEVGLLNGPNADQLIDELHISSVGISEASLIHPGSSFVLTNVDVDQDGDTELIVQPAPEGYNEGVE